MPLADPALRNAGATVCLESATRVHETGSSPDRVQTADRHAGVEASGTRQRPKRSKCHEKSDNCVY